MLKTWLNDDDVVSYTKHQQVFLVWTKGATCYVQLT